MFIRFTDKFRKQYKKLDKSVKKSFEQRLEMFLSDPFDPQLNNHQLTGKLNHLRSINITGDFRALYSKNIEEDGNEIALFEMLGTHSQLYK